MYKNLLHFFNNEISEIKSKKTISFKNTYKKIKYLRINLTKAVKDLYTEKYKTLIKEIEDDSKKWKYLTWGWENCCHSHTKNGASVSK